MPDLNVRRSPLFNQKAKELLGPDRFENFVVGLEWVLRRNAELGQRVRKSKLFVWPVYPGDGYVYITYYSVAENEVTLRSMIKRPAPVSPQIFDLED